MKRREFITLLGGAAAAWPLATRAQQPDQMRRIGVLMGYAESDLEAQAWITAFVQGFKELGWIVGRNVWIDYRFGAGDADRMRAYAEELVGLAPAVILAHTLAGDGRPAAGDPHHTNRVCRCFRPGRTTLCFELGASRRQHHRVQFGRARNRR